MLIVLSQKMTGKSVYADELFNTYRYPARYRNLIREGDVFIYYQGGQADKSQCFYYGIGTIGEIYTADRKNYYAKLLNCRQFEKKVPIYLPNGKYIEQLSYHSVRETAIPPWQNSIRPISQQAYDYILNAAGIMEALSFSNATNLEQLRERLKISVRDYFVESDTSAIYRIESIASAIGRISAVGADSELVQKSSKSYLPSESAHDRLNALIEYCETMKMSYSYKPVLIMALLHNGDKNGVLTLNKAVRYFRDYYDSRRQQGLLPEKKKCIYQREDITDQQIAGNIIANPIRVLTESGFFFYNEENNVFSISPEIWSVMERKHKAALTRICKQKLKAYFGD